MPRCWVTGNDPRALAIFRRLAIASLRIHGWETSPSAYAGLPGTTPTP